MSSTESNSSDKKGGKKTVGIIVLVLIILFLIGVIIYLVFPREEEKETRNVVITPDNVQEVLEQMSAQPEEKTPVGYYTVTMSFDWHFASGDAVSPDAYVKNEASNSHPVYVDVFLEGDMENAIYKSPIIPLGSSLENIALDVPLDAGTYDCVAVYHLVDEEQNTVDTLHVTLTLIIES